MTNAVYKADDFSFVENSGDDTQYRYYEFTAGDDDTRPELASR